MSMSKATKGKCHWSGWPWGRTQEAMARPAAARRTGRRQAARLAAALAAVCVAGCGHFGADDKAYAHARTVYRQGYLAQSANEALAGADRLKGERDSPLFWNFRLLAAEALTAQAK